jgi:hypothetical protein
MKWVRFKKDLEHSYLKNLSDERKASLFKIYEIDKKLFEEKYLDEYGTYKETRRFHKWGYEVEVSKNHNPDQTELNTYELYAGGWIDFWDTEVRQDGTDHALYFQFRDCGEKKYMTAYILQLKPNVALNVYVNIANPPTSTDPPPPKSGKPPY